ncbi:MAG: GntP family permease [Puniceicoccaceae bacterium]
MHALLIALIGMIIVVVGILVLRLHAFLALILAALVVTILTPRENIEQSIIRTNAVQIDRVDGPIVSLRTIGNQKVIEGNNWLLEINEKGALEPVSKVSLSATGNAGGYTLIVENAANSADSGDYILHSTQLASAKSAANMNWGEQVATGMGNTLTKIAILIAMASIVGKCLMDSGGAERIVLSMTRWLGERRTPLAFIGSGFTLSIPVFFDTVFYLLIPLGKAMRARTGRNYLLYVLSIVAGGTMAHSLVPPTPGPLFVAAEMNIDLGTMMIGGIIVGLITIVAGYAWAVFANNRWDIPLRPSEQLSIEEIERIANRDEKELPSLLSSLMPILIPVVLLGSSTIWNSAIDSSSLTSPVMQFLDSTIDVVGNKNIALGIAAFMALLLVIRSKLTEEPINRIVQAALYSGAVIILITAAGGAFGHALRQTGIAITIEELMPSSQSSLIFIGFLICFLVRTAQGSSTVAMITTVGIIAPIVAAQELSYHPVYIALAIGCGSKPFSWMNDSGFWVISKMSGLTEKEMLKANSPMTAMMGVVGMVVCVIGSLILPLA